ncbi:ATP-binding protein [Sungkyunkwania multivorans]|uniref:ATP-binding protein n=1 Tax=Sungkyunkwania multivorans TaxID=1173618 RepID=A0ABW3D1H8_9FLAO
MRFEEVLGQEHLKKHLIQSADKGRIPHAQLFVGPEGSGTLVAAIAYARYLICNKNSSSTDCHLKFDQLAHPDLHFAFPVNTNDRIKKHPVSNHFMGEWRQFLKEQPYGNLFDWLRLLGIEKKQGNIGVDEATDIVKKLSLKSFEGGHKVMIIWMAERLNSAASNKLLKLLEEPPKDTVFILIAIDEEQLISTIRSRCQVLHFARLPEAVIKEALIARNVNPIEAQRLAHQSNGNFNKAVDLVNRDSEDLVFEQWFVSWVRSAFKAKGNKGAIHDLIAWGEEIAKTGRETQIKFLKFCLELFRQAMLLHYKAESLVFMQPSVENFELKKFAPFVHENNVVEITEELQDAIYHIERNANSKIILTDLSIKLTRLLHSKAS